MCMSIMWRADHYSLSSGTIANHCVTRLRGAHASSWRLCVRAQQISFTGSIQRNTAPVSTSEPPVCGHHISLAVGMRLKISCRASAHMVTSSPGAIVRAVASGWNRARARLSHTPRSSPSRIGTPRRHASSLFVMEWSGSSTLSTCAAAARATSRSRSVIAYCSACPDRRVSHRATHDATRASAGAFSSGEAPKRVKNAGRCLGWKDVPDPCTECRSAPATEVRKARKRLNRSLGVCGSPPGTSALSSTNALGVSRTRPRTLCCAPRGPTSTATETPDLSVIVMSPVLGPCSMLRWLRRTATCLTNPLRASLCFSELAAQALIV